MLRAVLHKQRERRYAKTFQVLEFTIQDDPLHLIVEATGVVATGMVAAADSLRSGVSGLVISFAKRLNKLLLRRGRVWGDRFHTRELGSPSQVRNALVYLFRNIARHGASMYGYGIVDQLSSAPSSALATAATEDVAPRTRLVDENAPGPARSQRGPPPRRVSKRTRRSSRLTPSKAQPRTRNDRRPPSTITDAPASLQQGPRRTPDLAADLDPEPDRAPEPSNDADARARARCRKP